MRYIHPDISGLPQWYAQTVNDAYRKLLEELEDVSEVIRGEILRQAPDHDPNHCKIDQRLRAFWQSSAPP